MPHQPKPQIPALDGVRGLAIALVLVYHFTMGLTPSSFLAKSVIKLGSVGWCGVDLFFVLSGFLITGILDDARGSEERRPFHRFYGRRVLRVFPLYFATLFVLAVLGEPRGFEGLGAASLWNWTFTTNILVTLRGAWFPLSHFWSLAVEEHFYLFWPMVVVWGGRRFALRLTIALIILSLMARIALVANGSTLGAYVLTICRVDSLAIGGALCLWLRDREETPERAHLIKMMSLISISALMVLALWRRGLAFHDPVVQSIGYPLLAMTGASLIAAVVTHSSSSLLKVFTHPLPLALGRYSFGLYVFNSIAILFLDGRQTKAAILNATGSGLAADFGYVALAAILTLSAAWLSWHGLEKHALKAKRYLDAPRSRSRIKPVYQSSRTSSDSVIAVSLRSREIVS